MEALKFEVLEPAHGMAARSKFDSKVIEPGWLAINSITQAYVEENEKNLAASASLLRDFTDPEFLKTGTQKQLLMDFFMRYKRGDIESTDEYFKFLEEKQADRLFFEAIMKREDFEKCAEHLDDYLQAQQELLDIREDLNDYCDSIEGERLAL